MAKQKAVETTIDVAPADVDALTTSAVEVPAVDVAQSLTAQHLRLAHPDWDEATIVSQAAADLEAEAESMEFCEQFEAELRAEHPDWDEDTIVDAVVAADEARVAAAAAKVKPADSEAEALSTVESFDSVFGKDPLREAYRKFALAAKEVTDSKDLAVLYVGLGCMVYNLQVAEHKLAPSAYNRPRVMKKAENALRLIGCRESMVRPNDLLGFYMVSRLDRSTAGSKPGEARTFAPEVESPADWYGGHITLSVLWVLKTTIDRASTKPDEMDVWEFKQPLLEPYVRDWIKRLRSGDIATRQVEVLLEIRLKEIKRNAIAAAQAGLTEDEKDQIEDVARVEEKEKRLRKLSSKVVALKKQATDDLKMGKSELRDFLVNKSIIPPPDAFPTPEEIAEHLSPGDAKAIVQALMVSYASKPDRLDVLKQFAKAEGAVKGIAALTIKLAAATASARKTG